MSVATSDAFLPRVKCLKVIKASLSLSILNMRVMCVICTWEKETRLTDADCDLVSYQSITPIIDSGVGESGHVRVKG